ncbi:TetR/AcrR family transcriptional regulator [Mycobacteroides abscessus subsp. massiliense]|uniref:TetR/AcrR family transcriptional regulator n=1 Tax=Mycobacteroides abscessus TaxID=36809 RepID=UPI00266C8A16|nr:TetR/AcrR family transcriptional regulator [Mycobacteroides abscessus]MDO3297337.1 TetR/AcrR family transcriptional regulator [Mycobacteroides abscessus subsp. massiliense]
MPARTTRRNRPYAPRLTPEERREQLLDCVLEIVNTDGVGAVSMDAVARRAGVTRPVVYSHFTDTNHILRSSLDREERRVFEQIGAATGALGRGALVDALNNLLDAYLCAVTDAPLRWRAIYLVVDSGTPTFHKRVERGRTALAMQLAQIMKNSSNFNPDQDHELLARHLLAAAWESGRLLLTDPDSYSRERLTASLRRLVMSVSARSTQG